MQLELIKVQQRKAVLQLELEHLGHIETLLKNKGKTLTAEKSVPNTSKVTAQLNFKVDDEEEVDDVPAPKSRTSSVMATGKKTAKVVETLTESDEGDDLDNAFGSESDVEPTIGAAEIRALLVKIVKAKGESGKKKAQSVLMKHTKNKSGLINDIIAGRHAGIYADLKKI